MKKQISWLAIALGVIAVLLLVPITRDVILGFIKGETFFRGRPTRYWTNALTDQQVGVVQETKETLKSGGPNAFPVLVEAMKSADPTVRMRTSETLALMGSQAVQTLVEQLKDDKDLVRV